MTNPFNDPAAERSNKRVLSTARRQAAERDARLEETERELRLAKQDIDNPRPEFWEADLARFRAAKAAHAAARVGLPAERPIGTPISELSGRPGQPGYERFRDIAASWGYD